MKKKLKKNTKFITYHFKKMNRQVKDDNSLIDLPNERISRKNSCITIQELQNLIYFFFSVKEYLFSL